MMELLYEDLGGEYFLLDYSPSHSEMVVRRINKTNPNDVYNIDLFFKAVRNIHLTTKLDGIKVYKAPRTEIGFSMPTPYGRSEIYKIVDGTGNIGFIDASVFVVFHNKLDILKTSLGDFTWSTKNQEIFSTVIQ